LSRLLQRLVDGRSLSELDAERLAALPTSESQANLSSEGAALQWLAKEYGLEFTSLEAIEIEQDVISLFPARILIKEKLLPLRQSAEGVEVATSRLFDPQGLESLKVLSGLSITPVLATSEAIQREIKSRLGVGADTIDTLKDDAAFQVLDDGETEDTDLDQAAGDASIIRFVNQVLSDAIGMRATDIHLEPFEDELQIRYRVDGLLLDVPVPNEIKRFQPAIVSRIKILSHLDIAEKRLPQDGRIKLRVKRAEVDVRVSIIPMLHGEAVALGMILAARYSARRGEISLADAQRVTAAVDAAGLPAEISALGLECDGRRLADHMLHDKKMDAGTLPFILLRAIGEAYLARDVEMTDIAAFLDEQLQAH